MVLHIVLFQPRPDLEVPDRVALVESLEEALRSIPSIRRFHVGRRIKHGAGYEALMTTELDYAAVLEFDDLAGLQTYLRHPAHEPLGRRFMQSLAASSIYDYAMQGPEDLGSLERPFPAGLLP